MKKVISTVTLATLIAGSAFAQTEVKVQEKESSWTPVIALKAGYENQYIFRGIPLTDEAFQTQGKATWDTSLGDFSLRFFNSNPINDGFDAYPTELDFGLDYAANITDNLFVMAGYTYYTNKNVDWGVKRANEFYIGLGVEWEGLVAKANWFYDCNRNQHVWEGDLSYLLSLSQLGLENFGLEVGATVGYSMARDRWARQERDDLDDKNAYAYIAGRANVIYTINETADLSVGVRYAANNDHDSHNYNYYASGSQNLWWGASIGINF